MMNSTDLRPARSRIILLAPALLLAVLWLYWPGLGGGFVFDDFPNIVDNTALHVSRLVWNDWLAAMTSSPASALQRPLAMLTFAINHYFTGLDPRPMKATNLAIHLLNTCLLYGLMRAILTAARADRTSPAAEIPPLFITAAWALHPINFLPVLFVVQRMESLCHIFVFAGLWMYVVGRRRQIDGKGAGWWWIGFGLIPCTALGMLSKESAALLPLYAFCMEICLFRFLGPDGKTDRRLHALFALVLLAPALVGVAWLLPQELKPAAFASRDFDLAQRLLTEPRVVLDYLRWTLAPDVAVLSLYHDDYVVSRDWWHPAGTLPAMLALLALPAVALAIRKRRPLLSLGLLWFLAAQLLTATIIPLELVYEHRNYFASAGICLALADLLLLLPRRGVPRVTFGLVALAFLGLCAEITHLRALAWSNQVRFSVSEALNRPNSPRATYDYARTMVILTGYRIDSPYTKETFAALEQARRVPNSGVLPDQAALMFAARTERALRPEWWQDMYEKLATRPIGPQELASMAALTKCRIEGNCAFPDAALQRMFDAALARGEDPEVLNMEADFTLNVLHQRELALALWRKSSAQRPNEPQYHISLAKVLILLGRYDEARKQIATLRRMGKLGQNEKAALDLEQRLQSTLAGDSSADAPDDDE